MKAEFDLANSSIEGVNLIEASAGTGKTYTIVGIYLRLLLEKLIPVEKILVVTFTEAATSELKERVAKMIRNALTAFQTGRAEDEFLQSLLEKHTDHQQARQRLQEALHFFDESSIFTIHGFCQKMLTDYAFEARAQFDPELLPNQDPLIEELAMDYWRDLIYNASREYSRLLLRHYPSPTHLGKEFKKIIARPEIHFLPKIPESASQLFEQITALYPVMKATWQESQNAIATLLEDDKIWRKNNLEDYLSKAEFYFENDDPFENSKVLEKFTTTTLQSRAKEKVAPTHLFFEQCETFLKLRQSIPHAILLAFFAWAKTQLKQRKEALNQRSYDDLLQHLYQVLVGAEGEELAQKIRERFSVALIDEFQDTDPIQYGIFQAVFSNHDLFFIGDPKQSIYNFRGADIFAYLQAQKDAETQFTLETNWRSDLKLVAAVNTIFSGIEQPFVNADIAFLNSKGAPGKEEGSLQIAGEPSIPLHLWLLEYQKSTNTEAAQQQIAEATASEITRLLNLGIQGKATLKNGAERKPVKPGDIAVLTRTHKQAERIRNALWQRQVPCVLKTQINIFQTEEFKEVLTLAQAISEYSNPSQVKAALLTDMMGYDGTEVFKTMQQDLQWEQVINRFFEYHQLWKQKGFYQMMRVVLREEKTRTRLLSWQDGERRLTNVLQVMELFHQEESGNKLGMAGLLRWAQFISKELPESQEEYLIRLETDDDALKILTIHVSKGLEFPIVFCPFIWDSITMRDTFFHDQKQRLTWDLEKQEAHKEQAKKEGLAEDIRLVYVALTRAKACCYATCYTAWNNSSWHKNSPLAYLFTEKNTREHLKMLENRSDGSLILEELPPARAALFHPLKAEKGELRCQKFRQSLRQDWGLSSFSGLSGQRRDFLEGQDHDQHQPLENSLEEAEAEKKNLQEGQTIFTLPKGSNTGNCFHEILEELDFAETDQTKIEKLVREKLKKYNIGSRWAEVTLQMIEDLRHQKITSAHLQGSSFRLADIPLDQFVKEMPFHFPIRQFTTDELIKIVAQYKQTETHQALLQTLKSLDFRPLKGFMKGFLDLVFCYQDRYYILDWKTNHLGNHPHDYAPEILKASVEQHCFNLQYTIYTIALQKYLRMRLPDYDFNRHFGGVYYFFLRGIQAESEEGFGVYYDALPDSKEMINQLETTFSRENS